LRDSERNAAGERRAVGTYFPLNTFRLPDCPYETDTFFGIVSD
jgi:hypothetical protein